MVRQGVRKWGYRPAPVSRPPDRSASRSSSRIHGPGETTGFGSERGVQSHGQRLMHSETGGGKVRHRHAFGRLPVVHSANERARDLAFVECPRDLGATRPGKITSSNSRIGGLTPNSRVKPTERTVAARRAGGVVRPQPYAACDLAGSRSSSIVSTPGYGSIHGIHRGDSAKLHRLSITHELHNLLTP